MKIDVQKGGNRLYMKKFTLIIYSILIGHWSFSQDYQSITTLTECMGKPCYNINYYTDSLNNILFVQKTQRSFSFIRYEIKVDNISIERIISFYKNGKVAYITEAIDNEINGKLIYFNKKGDVDLILEYSKSKISGVIFSRKKDSLEKYKKLMEGNDAPIRISKHTPRELN